MRIGKLIRGSLLLLFLLVLLGAILGLIAQPAAEHPFFEMGERPLVIAHQGGDGLRPSNTLAAFEHAVELGADVLEMDIHSSADGVLVVIHDATVDRTTDGSGPVQAFRLAELQQLDAGYHWPTLEGHPLLNSGQHPFRGQGIVIPTLEEVFQRFPSMPMVIEIKQQEPPIEASFCALLRTYGMTEQVLVATFHQPVIERFREVCPEVATTAVESEVRLFYVLSLLRLEALYTPRLHAFQVPEFSGSIHVVTPRFVAAAAARNLEVHPWTINEAEQMERLLATGVQGLITDYPDVMLEILE